jgi:hypothetical protein
MYDRIGKTVHVNFQQFDFQRFDVRRTRSAAGIG